MSFSDWTNKDKVPEFLLKLKLRLINRQLTLPIYSSQTATPVFLSRLQMIDQALMANIFKPQLTLCFSRILPRAREQPTTKLKPIVQMKALKCQKQKLSLVLMEQKNLELIDLLVHQGISNRIVDVNLTAMQDVMRTLSSHERYWDFISKISRLRITGEKHRKKVQMKKFTGLTTFFTFVTGNFSMPEVR